MAECDSNVVQTIWVLLICRVFVYCLHKKRVMDTLRFSSIEDEISLTWHCPQQLVMVGL